jgi:sulfur carrier protein
MKLIVNGKEREMTGADDVVTLLRELGIAPDRTGTAVARNDEVVPRARWSETRLAEGDRIEIITAVQGG